MGTKNNPGKFDCYANAGPDEPMFILLGRDRHAPTLVRLWALLRARDNEDQAKMTEALVCADAMDAHRVSIGKSDGKVQSEFEALFLAATDGLHEHPEGFDHPCQCKLCLSYSDGED